MATAQVFEAFTLEDMQEKINFYIKDKKVITANISELGEGQNGVLIALVIVE